MKKLIIGIIVLGTIMGVSFALFFNKPTDSLDDINSQTDTQFDDNTDQTANEDDPIDGFSDVDELEVIDEDQIETEPVVEEVENKRLIPRRTPLSIYDGAFVHFSYDSSLVITDETLNSLKLSNTEGAIVATIDIFNNDKNLAPFEFVSTSENLINYYEEAEKNAIVPEEIYIDDKLHAVKFENYPGVVDQDVYLVLVDSYLVRINVQDMKNQLFNTTVMTFKKAS
jgi:hypothetical protein